jgi:ABC-type transport system involved in multi-copper enzyme maturation permease subunit
MFLGFGTFFRKEIADWVRSRRALIVGAFVIASAIFTTLVPFISGTSGEASGLALSMDPTANVLLGWGGQTMAVVILLATMALMSGERDRGTLAWSLTNPISPTSILAAKWLAAVLVLAVVAVLVPLAISVGIATVAYGAVPDLGTVGLFALLYMTVPAFYVALTLALGSFIKATAGIAAIGFVVALLPTMLGSLVPALGEVSPTAIGGWAMAVATGQPASTLTLTGFLVSMVVLAVGAKIVFDRQEV